MSPEQLSLKGYAIYSELSTLAHMLLGALVLFLVAKFKAKLAKPTLSKEPLPEMAAVTEEKLESYMPPPRVCQCLRFTKCAIPDCARPTCAICTKGYCEWHCLQGSG